MEREKEMSNDPTDYGMKIYKDQEVADHSVLILGLDKNLERNVLENRVKV